jgi:hypothetical protein
LTSELRQIWQNVRPAPWQRKVANSCERMAVLPRISDKKAKELYIRRVLSSPLINVEKIMSYCVPEVVMKLSKNGKTIVLMTDQTLR